MRLKWASAKKLVLIGLTVPVIMAIWFGLLVWAILYAPTRYELTGPSGLIATYSGPNACPIAANELRKVEPQSQYVCCTYHGTETVPDVCDDW